MPDAAFNPFGNAGLNSGMLGQDTTQGQSGPMPAPTSNPVVDQLVQQLARAAQIQKQTIIPRPLPPNHVQAGDVSGNFVNPSTSGGPARNARVSLAQSIGQVAAQAINRHEDKEARDLAYQITRVESLYNTLNDSNASPQEKQIATQELNSIDKSEWKKIQKATGVPIIGQEDKRTNVEKQAIQMAKQNSQQGQQGGQGGGNAGQPQGISQGGGQQPMSEQLGVPASMQQLNPMAQQFQQHLLKQTGLSPSAQATAELVKSGVIPDAGSILKYASDQQYYKVMEDKMGAEQATKFAQLAEKAQSDFQKYQAEMYKATNQLEMQEAKMKMQEAIHNGVAGIQEQRLALMKEQLDEKIRSDKSNEGLKADKIELDKITKTSKTLNDQISNLTKQKAADQKIAKTGLFASDKQEKAAADIQNIDGQLQVLQQQQKEINQKLEGINHSNGTDTSNDPTIQKLFQGLDSKL